MGIRTQSLRAAVTRGDASNRGATRLRDRFELLVPLGSGGFGMVWEGFDMLLERPVAIKELPIDGELSDAGDAMREARATARLNHPTIVSLYEIIAEADRIYMISELVQGSTLAELIDEGLLSDQDCGRIGYALCEALAHSHSHGVVHRDVKPANVIVTDEWIDGVSGRRAQPAKLMDFGIASIVDSESGYGPHAGSRGYASPEQEAGDIATPASDVYSLALVLFECLTGSRPGRGRHGRLARMRADLPIGLAECVDRCLEADPSMRPPLSELERQLSLALPRLSEDLPDDGYVSWLTASLRGLFARGPLGAGSADRIDVAGGPRAGPA
ncbi:MAG: serine/threonine-protein kinase, partial [Solirubrobacterales bacterium]